MPLPIHRTNSPSASGPREVFAIAAGKGGVGKSTVTVNLARALAEGGYSVGILDADIYGPSLRRMLPEQQAPRYNGPSLVPAICDGIKVISIAYFRQDNLANAVRAPVVNQLIGQFLNQVEWGPLDFLLIDFPPGTGDIQLTLSQKARLSGAVMVTTPQQVAVMDVRKAMHLFAQVQVPVVGVVENMSYYLHETTGESLALFGQGGGEALAAEAGVPFLGQIPIDPQLSRSGDEGTSLFSPIRVPSAAVKAFRAIAARLATRFGEGHGADIRRIEQPDRSHLKIEWMDGRVSMWALADLQRRCPCAGCYARKGQSSSADTDIGCVSVDQVGRYALRIQFTSGCSSGIYTYDMLHAIQK